MVLGLWYAYATPILPPSYDIAWNKQETIPNSYILIILQFNVFHCLQHALEHEFYKQCAFASRITFTLPCYYFPIVNIEALLGWFPLQTASLQVEVGSVGGVVHRADAVDSRYALRCHLSAHLDGDIQQEIA